MTLLKRIQDKQQRLTGSRRFTTGAAVVEEHRMHSAYVAGSEFKPPAYREYLPSSNAVYTCSTLRADSLASLPLKLYKTDAAGDQVEVTGGRLYALLKAVNPHWTFERLIRMTELSLCIWGEAFWFLERGKAGKGMPSAIWWAPSDKVTVVPDTTNYIKGFLLEPEGGGKPIPFARDEVIWISHPNILDEFSGLAPLAAARLAADTGSVAMQSNRNLFHNGMNLGGAIFPPDGMTFTEEQSDELIEMLDRRFKGVDKAHRWSVFRFDGRIDQAGMSPREAEFLGALQWSLEEVCRAYKVPLDLVGGQRSYQNFGEAVKALWTLAIIPEARFIASELNEKLLPLFKGEAALVEFDTSNVEALQEDEYSRWEREKEQIQVGALTINEWRESQGKPPVAWGDRPLQGGGQPGFDLGDIDLDAPIDDDEMMGRLAQVERTAATVQARTLIPAYGSAGHQRLMERATNRQSPFEKRFARKLKPLFEKQQAAVLKTVKQLRGRAVPPPFDKDEWEKLFADQMKPLYVEILGDVGQSAMADLALSLDFDLDTTAVRRWLKRATQRFAQQVNDTTWEALKTSLAEGIKAGETTVVLEDRVKAVMKQRIRSSAETIARTEVLRSYSGAQVLAWDQSKVVKTKTWLAALDDRTRDSHVTAHGQTVALDADFVLDGGRGPAPGLIGSADEDINCRCTMVANT